MRALLINPWIYDFAAYDLWNKPLGLLTIASHLERSDWKIDLIDCLDRNHPALKKNSIKTPKSDPSGCGSYYAEEIEKPALFKNIPRTYKRYGIPRDIFEGLLGSVDKPDIIIVTTGMTYWYPSYIDTIRLLRKRFPSTPVILGGIYANLCHEHAKRTSGADIVYKGSDITGIMRAIQNATGLDYNPAHMNHQELYPAYHLYPTLDYVTLRTSRGCPFRCTYCGWYLVDDGFTRDRASYVVDQIEYFNKNLGVRNFAFYDDALLYEAEAHVIPIMEGILKKNLTIDLYTPNGLHNRFMTRKIASLMKRSGFRRPRLALETTERMKQVETGAKTTNEEFLSAVECLKIAGYTENDIGAYILIGLPRQSIAEIEKSVEFIASRAMRIHLEEYSPIPGTPDYKRSGLPADTNPLYHNNSAFPLYKADWRTEIQRLKDRVHDLNRSR